MVAYPLLPLWHPRGKTNFFAAGPKPRLRQQARAPDWGPMETLGLIAGNGIYPRTVAAAARRAGVGRVVAAAFTGETDPALAGQLDAVEWLRVGQLSRMIRFFRGQGVAEAMMVGQISPRNLFELRPDLKTLVMLGRLKERNAESIFGAIATELAKEGITLLPATTFLEDSLPAAGPVCGPALARRQRDDAEFGLRIAKEMSRLDIGQTVVVRHGTVLAVEAFEGTNECIRRGGALGGGEALVAKVSKPGQDVRFDVPVVGPETIRICAEAGVRAIVIEAGCTLVLARDEVAELCRAGKVALAAMAAAPG